jgi:hypothetical protein
LHRSGEDDKRATAGEEEVAGSGNQGDVGRLLRRLRRSFQILSMSPLRLLFIGNSFTQRNDLPGMLAQLAAASNPPVEIVSERVLVNGASLRLHWNAGDALALIQPGGWDAVVLQEQSTLPIKNRKRYHENVRLFDAAIRAAGSRTLLYHTWTRRQAPETQDDLDAAVAEIATELEAQVVPVGRAWRQVLENGAGPELYDKDGSHPSPAGTYLAACVFYANLFNRSPEGLLVPPSVKLTGDDALLLQREAWASVNAAQS